MNRLSKPAKRILYMLRKNGNCYIKDLSFGEGKDGQRKSFEILRRLSDKGFVTSHKSPLRGKSNEYSVRAYYWLTDEGRPIADEIVKEVEDFCSYYKGW